MGAELGRKGVTRQGKGNPGQGKAVFDRKDRCRVYSAAMVRLGLAKGALARYPPSEASCCAPLLPSAAIRCQARSSRYHVTRHSLIDS